MAHAKLIIRPAPDELANIICDDKNNEASKEGEETAFTRAGAVCRGKLVLGERIKTLTLCRCVQRRRSCQMRTDYENLRELVCARLCSRT